MNSSRRISQILCVLRRNASCLSLFNKNISTYEFTEQGYHEDPIDVLYKKVGFLGIPSNKGQRKFGVDRAPTAVLKSGILEQLVDLNIDAVDYDDVQLIEYDNDPSVHGILTPKANVKNALETAKLAKKIIEDGRVLFSLGGDHSITLGTLTGHCQALHQTPCVIWVDAHADLNTPLTSESGNFHGMPLSFLLYEMQQYMPKIEQFSELRPCISSHDLVYVGLRSVDFSERFLMHKLGIEAYSMHEIDRYGAAAVIRGALQRVNPGLKRPIHLSFDIDVLDPTLAPSTGTPVKGGLTLREAILIASEVHRTGNLSAVDLVEVNPTVGGPVEVAKTLDAANEIIKACLGWSRKGLIPKNYSIPLPEDLGLKSRK